MKVKRRITSFPRGLFKRDRSLVVRSQQVAGTAETAEGVVMQQMEPGIARKHAAMLAQNRRNGNGAATNAFRLCRTPGRWSRPANPAWPRYISLY